MEMARRDKQGLSEFTSRRVIILPSLRTQITAPSVLVFNSLNYIQNTDSRRNAATTVGDIWSTSFWSL